MTVYHGNELYFDVLYISFRIYRIVIQFLKELVLLTLNSCGPVIERSLNNYFQSIHPIKS